MNWPLVEVSNLDVVARGEDGIDTAIVKDVSFSIARGEVLALIGESGSGKTTIALTLLGYARRGCRISGGSVSVGGTDVLAASPAQLRDLRGRRVAYVAQSASASFNPALRIIDQVIEGVCVRRIMNRKAARAKAVSLFRALALPSPESIGERYPHQVSGGQLQRLMAAMALMSDPEVVVFDEPTTALDVTTQIEVLRAFKRAIEEFQISAVYVSHDLAVVAQIADRVLVLRNGAMQEQGALAQIIDAPVHPYTRSLIAAAEPVSRLTDRDAEQACRQPPLLEITDLTAGYGERDRSGMPAVRVLDGVNLVLRRGTTLGVIGESGSGKLTLAHVIAGLLAPAKGSIRFMGKPLAGSHAERDRDLYRRIQLVFQNADKVLNPSRDVGEILAWPLKLFSRCAANEIPARVARLLDLVKLPVSIAMRRHGELSGGQKQRINLARALAAEPELIICDEVTSALDTVVGAAILDLLVELRHELDMSYLFISHDLSTVRTTCDDIAVLFKGQKVDACDRSALLNEARHPYTEMLIGSVPEMRANWLEETALRVKV
ncbi:ABC transporter, ATP-binding protein [Candidatus Burkholderia verschuerenii]|uniref:ABC transporter, ATP-binding protein n=1 Tax=Candidatus Burkholderia verschuerenii TaxID=242163 RepID=A0A0L0MIM1_9BURK|nr:ABC transporter ATP-binding protein [Candidatus Burkholderia verschuerenii]KND62150.1 ABC transporter, ATP-binding protein [Candidatus Burkholderia verschuerenii]